MSPETPVAGQKIYHRVVAIIKFVGDFLLLNLSTFVVLYLRENMFRFAGFLREPLGGVVEDVYYGFGTYLILSSVYSLVSVGVFFNRGLYARQRSMARLDELYLVMKSLIISAFLMMAITMFLPQLQYGRAVVIGNFVISLACIDLWRIALRKGVGFLARRGVGLMRAIIYGAGKSGRILSNQIKLHPEFGLSVVGYIDDDPDKKGKTYEGIKVLGAFADLPKLLVKHDVDEILIAIPSAPHRHILNVVFDLRERQIPFLVIADLFELVSRRVSVTQIGSIPLLRLWRSPLEGWQGYIKRIIDIAGALAGIILPLPLWLLIIILIKIDSKGPVFYRQERLGKDGRPFRIYKFRSMVVGAHDMLPELADYNEMDGPIFKIKKDPRVTRVGRILRKFSIDEFPQLLNVLKGDMSLVGPRPPIPDEVEKYERWQHKRLTVPQGLTGLWQVSGRNLLTFEEMVRLDIYYIENWSLWLDLKILLKTIPVVVLMRGAY
ncbi:MAG: sugar transferase [Candidatus Zixiibacteriota bacterium]|jgi:exopolysaccharide biosynthesis polyprenyl glycosylphosphotransferase